jgi:hypothetical protein
VVGQREKVRFTGKKTTTRSIPPHRLPGGIKTTPQKVLSGRFPERVLEKASSACCPRKPARRKQMTHLRVSPAPSTPTRRRARGDRLRRAQHQERPEPVLTDTPASAPAASGFDTLRELTGAPVMAADLPVVREPKIDALGRSYATGKRKNAIARVWIKPGSGRITINGRDQEIYFARPRAADDDRAAA